MTLQEYVDATEQALFANPPRNSPSYADDPKRIWRMYMRNFGAGLSAFDERSVRDTINSLYGRWFVRLEFHSKMPDIDAKEFFGWIRSADQEQREKERARGQEYQQAPEA